jgi:RNA 3'-terminal phosphate cyclase (ATP)
MLSLDGSVGEGGGQILRTSLALSLTTGRPFRMVNIRARRSKPGLMRQHLTAVQAAAAVCHADVAGAVLGSSELTFRPGPTRAGDYAFSVGTAGSATLVLQTILPALMLGREASSVRLEGGTHNPTSPPFDFLARAFLPLLGRMGPRVEATLKRPGFYPAGGGRMRVVIQPTRELARLDLLERGALESCDATAMVANLPRAIAERELRVVGERLGWAGDRLHTATHDDSIGPGNVVVITLESENVTEVFTGFGQRGVRAEAVAEGVARLAAEYLEAGVPVGEHLADQLLLPMALAGGGALRSLEPSSHAQTQADVIRTFLDVETRFERVSERVWHFEVGPR